MSEAFADIHKAAALLREGRLVAFPTETVYGLGADAFNANAVHAVYEVKGRPPVNPLIVHVSGPEMARRVVKPVAWDERADALARAFWPGPLSIILPRAEGAGGLPREVTAGGPNVAVRCPDHPVALALLFEFGGPLVGPSANPSGMVSPTKAEHVREAFAPDVVYVLEGGACRGGIESTVVSLVDERVRVLRPGLISAAEISRVLGQPVESGATKPSGSQRVGASSSALDSPGMLERHYAPSTRSFLVPAAELQGELQAQQNSRAAVLTVGAREVGPPHIAIEMPVWAEEYAAALYSKLREADASGVDRIIIEKPEPSEVSGDAALWEAILDRLRRATAE